MSEKQISDVTIQDLYAEALEQSSNEPLIFYGHTLNNVRDFLINNADQYQQLANQYQTLGEYLDVVKIGIIGNLYKDDVELGYGILEKVLNSPQHRQKKLSGTLDMLFLSEYGSDSQLVAAAASAVGDAAAKKLADDNHKPKTCQNEGGKRRDCNAGPVSVVYAVYQKKRNAKLFAAIVFCRLLVEERLTMSA